MQPSFDLIHLPARRVPRARAAVISCAIVAALVAIPRAHSPSGAASAGVPRWARPATGLALERPTRDGAFVDVVGRRSALLGYEHRGLEAWVYPLKLVDDVRLAFSIGGYPLDIEGTSVLANIRATPEATTFRYAHAAFTVDQVMFAPVDEPAIVLLLDVRSVLPLRVHVRFRPRLRLMWPAGLQIGNTGWNASEHLYELSEETGRFAGVIGSPAAREGSLMPYQEEPRDVPVAFDIDPTAIDTTRALIPIVIAGSTSGMADARAAYARVLDRIPALLQANVDHYRAVVDDTLQVVTPDERVNAAFAWSKVGIDKGFATNPLLGTGLIAGFRTSGESERPGFAWFFGRDALWTTWATTSYGDVTTTRTALSFLRGFQREDGKIPHEISQSASLIPWFTGYPYAWASADATPLYVAACDDYWRTTGDEVFIREGWPSIVKAFRFSAATDTDGNGLIENTKVGHGWVEGGALSPPHEEIYLQGAWLAALDAIGELARRVVHDEAIARDADDLAARARRAIEQVYWLPGQDAYAYATKLPRQARVMAEPGPDLERRQRRLDGIAALGIYDERTVLTSVPLWWHLLQPDRADHELDSIGSGALATDWGQRLLASTSELYDPLSYHYGSVWPLFTGWASMAAYRYGRSQVGYQALMANALLTDANALGYVTELLSGSTQAPFGRSSHHQVWSEAMVATPIVRGLAGLEVSDGGQRVTFAPGLPADWDTLALRHVRAGDATFDLSLARRPDRLVVRIEPRGAAAGRRFELAPALPLDADIRGVTVNGTRVTPEVRREGDVQRARVEVPIDSSSTEVEWLTRGGSDVYRAIAAPAAGASSRGLRILRSRAAPDGLHLLLDGLTGQKYVVWLRTPRIPGSLPTGVRRLSADQAADARRVAARAGGTLGAPAPPRPDDVALEIAFDGEAGRYVRREVVVRLR